MTAETIGKTTRMTLTVSTIVSTIAIVFLAGAWASTMRNGMQSINDSLAEMKADISEIADESRRDSRDLRDRVARIEATLGLKK